MVKGNKKFKSGKKKFVVKYNKKIHSHKNYDGFNWLTLNTSFFI